MKTVSKILLIMIFYLTSSNAQIEDMKIIDLTYAFDEKTIYWPTAKRFEFETGFKGITEKGFFYSANEFCTAEHGGTHMDAPIHFYEGQNSVDEIPLNKFIGEGVVIDVSKKCEKDRDYRVTAEDFISWEKENGQIPAGSIILLKTGFGKYWPDRNKYMGTDERGEDAIAKLHFPGLHTGGAEWLVKNKNIKAVGIESPSIDYGQSTHFETHVYLAKNNIPILENIANLDELPLKNFIIIALPMKIKGGSGGPTRIIALIK